MVLKNKRFFKKEKETERKLIKKKVREKNSRGRRK